MSLTKFQRYSSHILSEEEIERLKEEYAKTGIMPNPHNKGFYHYLIETMKALGTNNLFSLSQVRKKFKEITSSEKTVNHTGKTFWIRFLEKAPKNKYTAMSWDQKFDQNVEVLQRLGGNTPYGQKLLQLGTKVLNTRGCTIDIYKTELGEKMIMLNTNNDYPINKFKKQKE